MRKFRFVFCVVAMAVAVALIWTPTSFAQQRGMGFSRGKSVGHRAGPGHGKPVGHRPGSGYGKPVGHRPGGPGIGPGPGFAAYGAGGLNYAGIGSLGYSFGNVFGYGFGGFAAASPYSLGQVPVPPYFSLHPPVYYSHPVPRPYGYSPYAYPGWVGTPDLAAAPPCPQELDNPYVAPTNAKADESTPAGKSAKSDEFASYDPKPQHIVNPYVDHPSAFPPAFDMEVAVAK